MKKKWQLDGFMCPFLFHFVVNWLVKELMSWSNGWNVWVAPQWRGWRRTHLPILRQRFLNQ
jgi:hypothetical protein